MKKILSYILVLILSISVLPTLVACDEGEPEGPIYSESYVWDDEYHWRPQLNGSEVLDYAKHYNPGGDNTGRCKCGYYFPCVNLVFNKITLDGVVGYELVDYDEYMSPNFYHVEVPAYYQGENDESPLPVLSIANYALSNRASTATATYGKCEIKLKSVKLNEGLVRLGVGAFCYSNIAEIVVPNSVTYPLEYTFMYCSSLKRIVIGNGVKLIKSYTFCNSNLLEEVILGSSVEEILPRNFIGNGQLKRIVMPRSLISIPEGIFYNGNVAGVAQIRMFDNNPDIFFEITAEEYEAITIEAKERDPATGRPIPPYTDAYTHYGWVRGWDGISQKYFDGEWHYDENGTPVPN